MSGALYFQCAHSTGVEKSSGYSHQDRQALAQEGRYMPGLRNFSCNPVVSQTF